MAQINNRRTIEELNKPEYNYFLAFKIDLNETNSTKIEAQIKTITSDPKGGVLARRLLELKTDAMEIMCNDSVYNEGTDSYKKSSGGRKLEATRAKEFKLKDATSVIELLCRGRKTILKSEIIDICNTANKPVSYFTEQELLEKINYLLSQGVKIIDNVDSQIPFSDYQLTEKQLSTIGKQNLYDFLNIKNTASIKEIEQASTEIYKSGTKTNDLKKKQSISTLCGAVKKILLSSSTSRKNYDNYLILKEEVWDALDKRKGYGLKEITLEEYRNYTQKIIELLKVKLEEAEKIFAIGCKYYQMTIIGKSDENDLEYCPYPECGKLYVRGAKSCPHCGKSLIVKCWNCGGAMNYTFNNKSCPACKATFQSKNIFERKLKEAELFISLENPNLTDFNAALQNLQNVYPYYNTKQTYYSYKKIAEIEKIYKQKQEEEATLGKKYREEVQIIRSYMISKKYQLAYNLANALKKNYPIYCIGDTEKLLYQIKEHIQKANAEVQKARQYVSVNDEKNAIAMASKALEICSDLLEAKQIIEKYPPRQPTAFKVFVTKENVVRLEWIKIPDSTITYTIIKKIGSAPTSIEDGILVESSLTLNFYEDNAVVSATPYYYAIFSERMGVASPILKSSSPIILYLDVSNITQEIIDGKICVHWTTPVNVKGVEVYKKIGSISPTIEDGVRIPTDKNTGFTDNEADVCSYLIRCQYQMNTSIMYSKGIAKTFKPFSFLKPLSGIQIISKTDSFVFEFDKTDCKIDLFYSQEKISATYNLTVRLSEYNQKFKGLTKLDYSFIGTEALSFSLPENKLLYIYPMVSNDQLFIMMEPILINTIPPIEKFSYRVEENTIIVTGMLNPNTKNLYMLISDKGFEDSKAIKASISKDNFNIKREFSAKLLANSMNYITLYSEFERDNQRITSKFLSLDEVIDCRDKQVLRYSLFYKVSPKKPFKLIIEYEATQEIHVPELLLVKGNPTPLEINSGELVRRLEPIVLKKGLFHKRYTGKVILTLEPDDKNMKYKLFTSQKIKNFSLKKI